MNIKRFFYGTAFFYAESEKQFKINEISVAL